MRTLILILVLLFCGSYSFSQKKMSGIGGELSVLSVRPTARMWFTKTIGLEVFAGLSSEVSHKINPNDYEGGIKYLHSFLKASDSRTYLGAMGKWKRVDAEETYTTVNLPVVGLLIGKEWYHKRARWKGFAIELGYQLGEKKYEVYNPVNHMFIGVKRYQEFPLILNLRYTFYKKR